MTAPFVWTGPVWDTLQPSLKCSWITAAGKVRSSKSPHPHPCLIYVATTSGFIYADQRQASCRYGEAGLGGKGLDHDKREGDHVETDDGQVEIYGCHLACCVSFLTVQIS